MSEECGDSRNQIHRYIRLTELIPELLQMVDEKKLALRPAVTLSYGLSYEQQSPGTARLHIVVHSNYLSGNSGCTLELWGPESYSIPLYFTDGTCTVDITVAEGAYHASFWNSVAEIPDAVYGAWRDFVVDGGGYYDIAYLLDRDILGQNGNVAAWIRAIRWLPRNRVSGRPK